jgi:hypothetical protein
MNSKLFSRLLLCGWLLAVISCGEAKIYPERPLGQQILRFRKGHTGLTHGRCLKHEGEKCADFRITDYDLGNADVRAHFDRLGFICRVGVKRFKICRDKIGLCRHWYEREWFLAPKRKKEEHLAVPAQLPYLIDAGVECFNGEEYPFEDI